MIAVYLMPVYILFHIHVYRWFLRVMKSIVKKPMKKPVLCITAVLYGICVLSFVIAFFLPNTLALTRVLKRIGNYMLGVTLYSFMGILVCDIVWLFRRKKENKRNLTAVGGGFVMMFVIAICVYGAWHAGQTVTRDYEIDIDGAGEDGVLNVCLIADLHMGYNTGVKRIRKMVDMINEGNPDIVVFAGDFFDNEYEALENPDKLSEILREIKSKYGVYSVYGNHDIDERILAGFTFPKDGKKMSDIRMDEFIDKSGITRLSDEGLVIGDMVYLYGRPDEERPGRGIEVRKSAEEIMSAAPDMPVIIVDHEPKELDELAAAGVDVDLCGHTHDGQVWPLNLFSRWVLWENSAGVLRVGDMTNIVTSGFGLFGPNMRVGTDSEICRIKINLHK